MAYVDFHLHTTCSDGIVTPAELVQLAAANGVGVMAVTDHDNIDCLEEAAAAAEQHNLKIISGVEVSTKWHDRTIHILVYGFDRNHKAFVGLLKRAAEIRKNFFCGMIELVAPNLVGESVSGNGSFFGRSKTVDFMIEKGLFPDDRTAWETVKDLVNKQERIAPMEVFAVAHAAGAVAVLAHPFAPKISLKLIDPSPDVQKKLVA